MKTRIIKSPDQWTNDPLLVTAKDFLELNEELELLRQKKIAAEAAYDDSYTEHKTLERILIKKLNDAKGVVILGNESLRVHGEGLGSVYERIVIDKVVGKQ